MLYSLVENNQLTIVVGDSELEIVTPYVKSKKPHLYVAMDASGLICIYADEPTKKGDEWDNTNEDGVWLDYTEIAQYDGDVLETYTNVARAIINPFYLGVCECTASKINF